jgi:hypothetical protein
VLPSRAVVSFSNGLGCPKLFSIDFVCDLEHVSISIPRSNINIININVTVIFYHTNFTYHNDVCCFVYMFHTNFLLSWQRTGTNLVYIYRGIINVGQRQSSRTDIERNHTRSIELQVAPTTHHLAFMDA